MTKLITICTFNSFIQKEVKKFLLKMKTSEIELKLNYLIFKLLFQHSDSQIFKRAQRIINDLLLAFSLYWHLLIYSES